MIRIIAAIFAALLCVGIAQAQDKPATPSKSVTPSKSATPNKQATPNKPAAPDKPDSVEEAARLCVHNRLKELTAEDQRGDIATDAALKACTNDLQADLKNKKKSYCEAVAYTGWLVADENSKLNGVQGGPYHADKGFLQSCGKTESWEKHR